MHSQFGKTVLIDPEIPSPPPGILRLLMSPSGLEVLATAVTYDVMLSHPIRASIGSLIVNDSFHHPKNTDS